MRYVGRKHKRIWLPILLAVFAIAGCRDDEEDQRLRFTFALPEVDNPRSPAWSPRSEEDDRPVARVSGVPILVSELREAVAAAPTGTTVESALERLVEREILAQRALTAGYYRPQVVGGARRSALVAEFIEERLVRPDPETFFSEDLLRQIYRHPSFRVKFEHKDIFRVLDAQLSCCDLHYSQCDQQVFEACMAEEVPFAEALYEAIRDLPRERDLLQTLVNEWSERRPRLALREYSFFYDVNLPHEQQRGHSVVNENVVNATLALEEGDVSPPVRSRNAWHILVLEEHRPEQRRTLDDADVRRELIAQVLPPRLEAEYRALVQGLRHVYDVRVEPDVLEKFFWGLGREAEIR